MKIFETFVTKSNQLNEALIKIQGREIPEFFNQDFLEELDLKRPNSIHYVMLFKKLGLINEDEEPILEYYSQFVESEERSRAVIAELVKKAYAQLFELDNNAHRLPEEKIHGLFRQIMGEEKSSTFVQLVADTFIALSKYADWNSSLTVTVEESNSEEEPEDEIEQHEEYSSEMIDTAVEEHIAEMEDEEDDDNEALIYEEELVTTEVNGQYQNGQTKPGMIDNGISEWFQKPATPHEEFLLELLDGNSDHHYRGGIEAPSTNEKQADHLDHDSTDSETRQDIEEASNSDSESGAVTAYEFSEENSNGSPGGDIEASNWPDENITEPFNSDSGSEETAEASLDSEESASSEEVKDNLPTESEHTSKNGRPNDSLNWTDETNQTHINAIDDNHSEKNMETINLAKPESNGNGVSKIENHSDYLKNALIKRANLLTELGRYEEAVNAFDEILKYAKTDITVGKEEVTASIYQKARLLEKLNRLDEAVNTYDDLIQQYFVRVPVQTSQE